MENPSKTNTKYVVVALAAYILAEIIRKSVNFNIHESKFYNYSISILSIIAIVTIYLLLKRYINRPLPRFKKNGFEKSKIIEKIFIVLILYVLEFFLEKVIGILIKGISQNEKEINEAMRSKGFIYSLFDSGIRAPIIEEVIFRGVLFLLISSVVYRIFKDKSNKNLIAIYAFIVFSTLIFGWLHVSKHHDYEYIFGYALLGLFLSIVYVLTKNLLYAITFHMINNVMATFSSSEHISHMIFNFIIVVLALCCVVIVVQKRRDKKHST